MNLSNAEYEELACRIFRGGLAGLGLPEGGFDRSDGSIRDMAQAIIQNAMAEKEAVERMRRSMPEWSKYYKFQDWLEKMKAGGLYDVGDELAGAISRVLHRHNDNDDDDDGLGELQEEMEDMKMPAEPLNKKAKIERKMCEDEVGDDDDDDDDDDDEIEWEDSDLDLDNMYKDNDLQRQIDTLGPYLFGKGESEFPPSLFWRALWSVEEHHDVFFGVYRLRHFDRWDREVVSADDPWRWKNFGAGPDGPSIALYFPGKYACHDAKCAWAGVVVEESEGNQLRPMFDTSWPRDTDIPNLDEVGDVISDIMLASAPDELSVCLYIDRTMIDSFLAVAVVREDYGCGMSSPHQPGICSVSKFLSSPYLRDDSPITNISESASEETLAEQLERFKQWLKKESPVIGTIHKEHILAKLPPKRYDRLTSGMNRRSRLDSKETKDDLVLLARRDNVPKDADSEKVLNEMVQKLGLNGEIVTIQATRSRNKDIHSYAYFTRDKIGGNIHYPDYSIPLDDVDNNEWVSADCCTTSVSFTWTRTEKLTEEHVKRQKYKQAFETDFLQRAEARKEASNGRITYILWPREHSDESDGYFSRNDPKPITLGNAHIIWLPGDYDSMEEKAFDELIGGGGGGGGRLRFTRTYDGNIFWEQVMAYFRHYVVDGRDACLLYEDSYEDGEEREYTTIPNEHCLKMLHLLIITRAFIVADHELFFDHEFPLEEIVTFFDKFGQEWRRVLRQSDETLGFGLIDASSYATRTLVSAVTEMAANRSDEALNGLLDFQSLFGNQTPAFSREGLYALLEFHGSWLEGELRELRNNTQQDGDEDEDDADIEISLVPNEEDEEDEYDDAEEEDENEEEDEDDGIEEEEEDEEVAGGDDQM